MLGFGFFERVWFRPYGSDMVYAGFTVGYGFGNGWGFERRVMVAGLEWFDVFVGSYGF